MGFSRGYLLQLAGRLLTGALLFGALAWGVHAAVLWLIPHEEALADVWYGVYLELPLGTGAVLAAIVLLSALHLRLQGREDMRPRGPADVVRWWGAGERFVHWCLVLSFVALLVTGLWLYFAPPGLPSDMTRAMRRWHFGEAFMIVGGLLLVLWHRDALPRRYDAQWLANGGGYLGQRGPLPAGRFNAGQKLWFWLEVLLGFVMAVSGWELQHQFTRFDDGYLTLLALHLGASALFVMVLAVHFYLAVIAVRGALAGMIFGRVGRQGARRLHSEAPALKGHPLD